VTFGIAYFVVRALHLLLYAIAGRGDRDLATQVPALAALGLVAVVFVALITYEALRHRESRSWIRSRRGAFTIEEAMQVEPPRARRRTRR
jgi:hypothetical protein